MYQWLRKHVYPRWPENPLDDQNLTLCANALVTHTLEERGKQVYWTARTFFRGPDGFKPHTVMSKNVRSLGHRYSEKYEMEMAVA